MDSPAVQGKQQTHRQASRQPSPYINAHNTLSSTTLRARSKQRRSEQLDPPWPFHQGPTVSRLVSFEPSHWESLFRIFNLILWCENLPKHLAISRTIFIPKKSQASLPGEFRPISISSVFARVLHKILAQRIDAKIEMDDQQTAFRAGMDGCRDNTVLLDALLRSRYQQFKSTFAATLDLARAFDSVDTVPSCGQQKQLAFHLC